MSSDLCSFTFESDWFLYTSIHFVIMLVLTYIILTLFYTLTYIYSLNPHNSPRKWALCHSEETNSERLNNLCKVTLLKVTDPGFPSIYSSVLHLILISNKHPLWYVFCWLSWFYLRMLHVFYKIEYYQIPVSSTFKHGFNAFRIKILMVFLKLELHWLFRAIGENWHC